MEHQRTGVNSPHLDRVLRVLDRLPQVRPFEIVKEEWRLVVFDYPQRRTFNLIGRIHLPEPIVIDRIARPSWLGAAFPMPHLTGA
jgi:hypothetical protein